jgi:hypothetical protein
MMLQGGSPCPEHAMKALKAGAAMALALGSASNLCAGESKIDQVACAVIGDEFDDLRLGLEYEGIIDLQRLGQRCFEEKSDLGESAWVGRSRCRGSHYLCRYRQIETHDAVFVEPDAGCLHDRRHETGDA